jgi:hypothetical protein
MFTAMCGWDSSIRRMSPDSSASADESSSAWTVADRTSELNIASSPNMSPGRSSASVIVRPSVWSWVTRTDPLRTT